MSPNTDLLLECGSEALARDIALQIEGLASMDVLKPLIQALLPYAQKDAPTHAGTVISSPPHTLDSEKDDAFYTVLCLITSHQ